MELVGAAAHVRGGPESEDQQTEPAPGPLFLAPAHQARGGSHDQSGHEGQRNVDADEVLEVLGERPRRPEAKDLVEREREGQRPVRAVPQPVRHHLLVEGAGTGRDRKRRVESESKPGRGEREGACRPDPQRPLPGGERERHHHGQAREEPEVHAPEAGKRHEPPGGRAAAPCVASSARRLGGGHRERAQPQGDRHRERVRAPGCAMAAAAMSQATSATARGASRRTSTNTTSATTASAETRTIRHHSSEGPSRSSSEPSRSGWPGP